MIFKEFNINETNGCILPNSMTLKKYGKPTKIQKGTKVNNEIIELLKKNDILKLYCFKLEKNELDENLAAEKICKSHPYSKFIKCFRLPQFKTGSNYNILGFYNGIETHKIRKYLVKFF